MSEKQAEIQKIFRGQLGDDNSAKQLADYFIGMAQEKNYDLSEIQVDFAETLRGSGADDEMLSKFTSLVEKATQLINPQSQLESSILKLNINPTPTAAASTTAVTKKAAKEKKPKSVSGWSLYLENVRQEIKTDFLKANPNSDYKEDWPSAQKKASTTWKAMSDTEKKPWQDKAEERKRELGIESKANSKPESEKRAESGYQKFIEIEGAKLKGTGKNVMKELGPQWKAMSDVGKQKYKDLAAESNREKGRLPKSGKAASKASGDKTGVKVTAWTIFCQEYKSEWESMEGDKKTKSAARSQAWADIKKDSTRHGEYVTKANTINTERGIPMTNSAAIQAST